MTMQAQDNPVFVEDSFAMFPFFKKDLGVTSFMVRAVNQEAFMLTTPLRK